MLSVPDDDASVMPSKKSTQVNGLLRVSAELHAAKLQEEIAKARRIAAEDRLVAFLGFKKAEGRERYVDASEAGACSIVVEQPINNYVDTEGVEKLLPRLGAFHPGRKVFRRKYDVDVKAMRALAKDERRAWLDVCDVVTRKPGKVAVKIEEIEASAISIDADVPPAVVVFPGDPIEGAFDNVDLSSRAGYPPQFEPTNPDQES